MERHNGPVPLRSTGKADDEVWGDRQARCVTLTDVTIERKVQTIQLTTTVPKMTPMMPNSRWP